MRERGLALTSLALATLARLLLAPLRRLSPDEAYYVCASRSGWPIADHPPLIGWLIAAAEHLAPGPIELRVRVVAIALQVATALGIAQLAASLRADAFAAGVFLATWGLMPWVSGLITTPDDPLLAATAWLLVVAARRRPSPLALAVLAALCCASKVTGLVVVVAVAVDLRRQRRAVLALLAGAAATLPLLRASFVGQLAHVLGRGPFVSAPRVGPVLATLNALAAIVLLFGPAVLLLSRGAPLRSLPGARPLLFALLAATLASAVISGRAPEPNWIAPAFVALFALAATRLATEPPRRSAWLQALHLAPALLGIALWAGRDVLPPQADPLARVPRHDGRAVPDPLPPYARPALACVYDGRCAEINVIFNTSPLK